MGGEVGFQAQRALDQIQSLREEFPGVSFVEKDERLTTRLAVVDASSGGKKGRGKSKKSKKKRVDHLAAARMLQEHLDARGNI